MWPNCAGKFGWMNMTCMAGGPPGGDHLHLIAYKSGAQATGKSTRRLPAFCMQLQKPLGNKQLVFMITPEAQPTGADSWNTNCGKVLSPFY
jgi:hypothetical protein